MDACANVFWALRTLVCDFGTHTLNYGIFKNGKLVRGKTLANTGWVTVFTHCAELLKEKSGRRPTDEMIDSALSYSKNGEIWWMGKAYSLIEPEFAPRAYSQLASLALNYIQNEFRGGTEFDKLIGSGGLWPYVNRDICEAFPDFYIDGEQEPFKDNLKDVDFRYQNMTGLVRRDLLEINVRRMLASKAARESAGNDLGIGESR